jgi:hypothetical protein
MKYGTNETLTLIEIVADSLNDLLEEVVFVGGASVVFLVPEITYPEIRQTEDVDVIVDIVTRPDYNAFCKKLRKLGFREDQDEDAPICRYKEPQSNIKVDVMPLNKEVLGFTNKWYEKAIENAQPFELPSKKKVKYCSIPYFLGCKFEAFKGRNNRDYYGRDFEDICFILEKAENIELLLHDLNDNELKTYLANEFKILLNDPNMLNIFVGVLSDPGEIDTMLARMEFISKIS